MGDGQDHEVVADDHRKKIRFVAKKQVVESQIATLQRLNSRLLPAMTGGSWGEPNVHIGTCAESG